MDRIAGRIPVLESLRAKKRKARRLFVLREGRGFEAILEAAKGLPIETRSRMELDMLVEGGVHQGVVLEADPLPLCRAEDWVKRDFGPNDLVVVLDSIEDPQNFGAIVRSAVACGACGVVFGKDRSAPISTVSQKSAAGAMEYVDLVQATNVVRCLEGLKQAGFWVAALDPEGKQVLWDADLKGKIALVIGNEGKGIRRLVHEHCDLHLRIPLTGPIPSLNASVSAAIALAECLRQRV
ncbi:MAG: 23S rRNA (guanosine(2251)-2'-O)-methyltransferase RlmB [Candidatus Hydrogenedentes bacterium]|nr:23S rRNA (guanosine(2251)-2'-O)-methyltransferase RlmB [Candidatus Hydrogenedentota bacterium]